MRLTVGQDDTQNYKKAPEKQLFFRGQLYFATEGQPNFALGGQLRLPSGVKRARLFHSCVGVNNNGTYSFLDKTYNVALNDGESSWYDWTNTSNGMMRQEEHMIYRICNQYTNPAITMNISLKYNNLFKPYSIVTDKYLSGKSFIVNEMDFDYYAGKVETKIIEKK